MKWKNTVIFGLFAIAGLAYAYWPSPDPFRKYQAVSCPAPADRRQDLTRLMKIVMDSSLKGQFLTLESAFGMTAQERRVCKEMDGADPVEASLEVLKYNASELCWSDYEISSFEKNPKRFEVRAKTRNGKKTLRFSFRAQGKAYRLLSIAEG